MSDRIRILLLEDNEDDACLLLYYLKREGLNPDCSTVETLDTFRKRILEEDWDLILSDYRLPSFNGLDALRTLHETSLDIPFILLSGVIGEEKAVEALREGAQDFILKDRLERLAPAIRREIRECAIRRESIKKDQAIRNNERLYRSLVETSHDLIFRMDPSGHITYLNPGVKDILGYEADELLGLHFTTLASYESRRQDQKTLGHVTENPEKLFGYQTIYQHRNGSQVYFSTNITPLLDDEGSLTGFHGMAHDISAQKKAERRLEETLEQTVIALSKVFETRDPYTAGHQKRVADLSLAIGNELGLDQSSLQGLKYAGLLHDIGKIHIPSEILNKPAHLGETELALIKQHSRATYEILKDIPFPWPVAEIAYQHHERLDGSGYPRGLEDREIMLEARIIAVADIVEAMSMHRPYRPAPGLDAALERIDREQGHLFDRNSVRACLKLFREGRFVFAEDH